MKVKRFLTLTPGYTGCYRGPGYYYGYAYIRFNWWERLSMYIQGKKPWEKPRRTMVYNPSAYGPKHYGAQWILMKKNPKLKEN